MRGDDQEGKERTRQRVRHGFAPTPGAPAFFRDAARSFARIAKPRGNGSDQEEGKHQQKAFVAPAQINSHAQQKPANRSRAVNHFQAEGQHRQRQIDTGGQHNAPAKEGQIAVKRAALNKIQAIHEGAEAMVLFLRASDFSAVCALESPSQQWDLNQNPAARAQLEMSGKNPVIVLTDADLDQAAEASSHKGNKGLSAQPVRDARQSINTSASVRKVNFY